MSSICFKFSILAAFIGHAGAIQMDTKASAVPQSSPGFVGRYDPGAPAAEYSLAAKHTVRATASGWLSFRMLRNWWIREI